MNYDLSIALRGALKSFCRAGLKAAVVAFPLLPCKSAENLSAVQAAPAAAPLSASDAQADFDFMRKALEEAHTGLYRFSAKTDLDRAFDRQRTKLSRPMARMEFFEVMAETLALIRCGHTSINPDDEMGKAFGNARLFPLQVMVEDGRLLVQSNDTPDNQTILPGMEVIEINGHQVTHLLHRFVRIDSADGDIETIKWVHIQRGFSMYYWFLADQTGEFVVKASDGTGRTVVAKLTGVSRNELGKSQNPVNATMRAGLAKLDWAGENLSMRFLKDPDVAQIRIRMFDGENYPRWIEDTFKTLREKGTKALIIDLRGNGGGADMYGAMLVASLTDQPFRYFDRITANTIDPSFKAHAEWWPERTSELRKEVTPNPAGGYFVKHKGLAKQAPGKYPFLGKVFVLIDGGTFSTAADFCAVTHHLKRATFIGEETGGGYYGSNSGLITRLTLPNSRFKVRLPMYEYWNAVSGYEGGRRGTIPDHVVKTKTASLLLGVDEQLDLALKLANNERK